MTILSALESRVASRMNIPQPAPGDGSDIRAGDLRGPYVHGVGLDIPSRNAAHYVELKGTKIQVGPFNSSESADQYVRQQGNGAEHVYTGVLPKGWRRIDAASMTGRGSPPSWTGASTSDALAGGQ